MKDWALIRRMAADGLPKARMGSPFFEVLVGLFGSIWVLGSAQRQLDQNLRCVDLAVSRSEDGAFMLQTPIPIALAFALRELALPAEAKAISLAVFAVVASFGLARLLIEHVPGMRRVLWARLGSDSESSWRSA